MDFLRAHRRRDRQAVDARARSGGILVTILLGIIGAVVGGFMGRALGFYGPEDPAGFLMSLLGAILLLVVYRLAVRGRTV